MQAQGHRAPSTHLSEPTAGASFAHPERNVDAIGIEKGMVIADFGAGSGHYALRFAERLQGTGRVHAIDVQPDLLRRIQNEAHRRGLKNLDIISGDIERPGGSKLAQGSADLVLLSNVLFQLEDPAGALREAWRVLKTSGRLAIIDWSESFGGMGPRKQHVISKEKAMELSAASGFKFLHEFAAGAHHYGLLLGPTLATRL